MVWRMRSRLVVVVGVVGRCLAELEVLEGEVGGLERPSTIGQA